MPVQIVDNRDPDSPISIRLSRRREPGIFHHNSPEHVSRKAHASFFASLSSTNSSDTFNLAFNASFDRISGLSASESRSGLLAACKMHGRIRIPVTPSCTSSLTPAMLVAMTGTPNAMASIRDTGSPSARLGSTKMSELFDLTENLVFAAGAQEGYLVCKPEFGDKVRIVLFSAVHLQPTLGGRSCQRLSAETWRTVNHNQILSHEPDVLSRKAFPARSRIRALGF